VVLDWGRGGWGKPGEDEERMDSREGRERWEELGEGAEIRKNPPRERAERREQGLGIMNILHKRPSC
jgi:hypothetical protein